jgi:hypothetical protein
MGRCLASRRAFGELLSELYDPEFDEALLELSDEADAHAELLGIDEAEGGQARVEQALTHWLEPLRAEAVIPVIQA